MGTHDLLVTLNLSNCLGHELAYVSLKPRSDWQVLLQVSCARKLTCVNGVSGAIFLVQKTGRNRTCSISGKFLSH